MSVILDIEGRHVFAMLHIRKTPLPPMMAYFFACSKSDPIATLGQSQYAERHFDHAGVAMGYG